MFQQFFCEYFRLPFEKLTSGEASSFPEACSSLQAQRVFLNIVMQLFFRFMFILHTSNT